MGSEIDDLFNEIMEWGVEDIRALWHHNAFLIEKNYPPKSEIEIENKKEIFAAATKGQDFSKWNNIQKAKLIVVCRFLHIKNSEITSLVKIDIPNCPVLKEVIGLLPKRTKGEISNLQLFYALHTEYTVVKVTWENVTSSWGPKVILTDSANKKYYYLFKNRTPEFEKDMKKYNKAAQLGWREQYTSTYEYEACCGGELSIASVGATQKCELLTTKFKNAVTTLTLDESKVRLKIVFGAIIDAYLYFELDLMATDNEEFRKTFPRLALDFESIVNKIGEYIILPIIKIDTQQFHVVHGDEWGGNFLFSEMEDSVFFIDFEDALYCEVGTKTVIKVGGDLSSRIFYDEKSNEDDNFSIFGMGICGSMGRLLAALIQYEEDISADRFKMIIEQFLKCFSDKLVEKRPAYRMYAKHLESQILAYAWDWGIYWNVKTRWRSGTFDIFEKIIKELLEEKDGASILTPLRSADTARDGDVRQKISGNNNIQINSGGSTIAAIGKGAMVAGRDIIIHSVDKDNFEILKKQIQLLEELLKNSKQETQKERKKAYANEASKLAQELQKNESVEISAEKYIELGNASKLAGRLEVSEGQYKQALRTFALKGDKKGKARSLGKLGIIADIRGDLEKAERLHQESLTIKKEIGDRGGEADSLNNLGNIEKTRGALENAERLYQESLTIMIQVGDRQGETYSLINLGTIAKTRGDLENAERLYQESLTIMIQIGDRQGEATSLNNLGEIAQTRGALDEAERLYQETLAIDKEIGDRGGEASSLNNLGLIAQTRGALDEAERLHQESLVIMKEIGEREGEATSLNDLGEIAQTRGALDEAERLYQESLTIMKEIGNREGEASSLNNLGSIAKKRGDLDEARSFYTECVRIRREIGIPIDPFTENGY